MSSARRMAPVWRNLEPFLHGRGSPATDLSSTLTTRLARRCDVAVFIREIRNNAGGRATIRNQLNGSQVFVGAGESKTLFIQIPKCELADQNQFDRRHVLITIAGGKSFAIWQASVNMRDRVRVSTDLGWYE